MDLSKDQFFGRERLVREIVAGVLAPGQPASFSLVGSKLVGKSKLLGHLASPDGPLLGEAWEQWRPYRYQAGDRVVLETERFIVVEPYAPRFPFETWILPKRHESHFEDADGPALQDLAYVLRTLMRKMEKVLENPAYNMMIHTAPVQEPALPHFHWHIEITPRLSRIAGFEWGTGFYINPTPPEEAAKFLLEAGVG